MPGYEIHKFYCINCGKEGVPLARKHGHMHGKFHFKQLWCCNCKLLVNHMECRNDIEVQEFKDNFKQGVYKDDAEQSISHCRSVRLW